MTQNDHPNELLTRLRRIEGQVRGLQKMLDSGRECEDVLVQLMAIRSALDRVGLHLLDHHLADCLFAGTDVSPQLLQRVNRALRAWGHYGPLVDEEPTG